MAGTCASPGRAASTSDAAQPDPMQSVFVDLRAESKIQSSSETVQSDPSQTIFVDLRAGWSSEPSSAHVEVAGSSPVTPFIDLSTGASPTILTNREVSGPTRTPGTRFIDLRTNASFPALQEEEEAAAPETSEIAITADQVHDPYEKKNRSRFETHVALHRHVIDPVENAYVRAVPVPLRVGAHNFLTNLETPSVLANNVLQGKAGRASGTIFRFIVNSTIGIVGILDIAERLGVPYRDDDFGQTLAAYGVGDSPYLLVPVIGPTNPRDLTGKIMDFFMNPLRYVILPGGFITSISHSGLHQLDKRSEDVGQLDALSHTSPDPYAAERTVARERRKFEIDGQ
jgi:phospholipid-binding lipoprotein MlaA